MQLILPTLQIGNRPIIGFDEGSTEVNSDLVMLQNFNGGGQYAVTYKNDPAYVRAVKTL